MIDVTSARDASQSLATRLLKEVEDGKKHTPVPHRSTADPSVESNSTAEQDLLKAAVREAKREIKQLQAQNAALSQQLGSQTLGSGKGKVAKIGDHKYNYRLPSFL